MLDQDETDLNCIDTSNITDMSELFYSININGKNIDVSKWDVSNVKNMKLMFRSKDKFNCDLSNWDVSNVEDMRAIFVDCKSFEGKGLDKWDVSNVKDMAWMFYNCKIFDCDLEHWDISNVKDMEKIFDGCTSLKTKPSWCKE